jgi:cullin-4
MIENKRIDELKLMFQCYSRNDPNLGIMVQRLNEFIVEKGTEIVQDQKLHEDAKGFTKKLLDFKEEIDKLLEESFRNNIRFEKGRDASFQQFMNLNKMTPALIANYTDMEMRQGIQGVEQSEIDRR